MQEIQMLQLTLLVVAFAGTVFASPIALGGMDGVMGALLGGQQEKPKRGESRFSGLGAGTIEATGSKCGKDPKFDAEGLGLGQAQTGESCDGRCEGNSYSGGGIGKLKDKGPGEGFKAGGLGVGTAKTGGCCDGGCQECDSCKDKEEEEDEDEEEEEEEEKEKTKCDKCKEQEKKEKPSKCRKCEERGQKFCKLCSK